MSPPVTGPAVGRVVRAVQCSCQESGETVERKWGENMAIEKRRERIAIGEYMIVADRVYR